jgi:hypocretin (orexin) receptor 2
MVLQTERKKELRVDTHFFTQCSSSWSDRSEVTFHVLKAVLLYTVPLIFMSVAYCQIVRVLWRSDNIPGHTETRNSYGIAPCNNGSIIVLDLFITVSTTNN